MARRAGSEATIVLEAERNLRYQLSYASKFTYLSRLMHLFHKSLSQHQETRAHLEDLFTQIKTSFQGIPELGAFTGQLRAQLEDLIGGMTHRLEVDFEAYNPVNFFHALRRSKGCRCPR
jgi:putative ATP-dependent endonuclease of OLD family